MKLRKRSYYFLLFVIYIAMSARSCTDIDVMDQSEFHDQVSTIEQGMQVDVPEIQSLIAFEEKAKHKLIDFGEYFSIGMDNKVDSSLRLQVRDQLLALFVDEKVSIEFYSQLKFKSQSYSLSELFTHNLKSDVELIEFSIDSIQIIQHLMLVDTDNYQGKISFIQRLNTETNEENLASTQFPMTIDFYLKMVEKSFGTESKMIWQVYLGDINSI